MTSFWSNVQTRFPQATEFAERSDRRPESAQRALDEQRRDAAGEAIVVVVDRSGSMRDGFGGGKRKYEAAKDAVQSFLTRQSQIDPADAVAIVAFDDRAETVAGFAPVGEHKHALAAAIDDIRTGGGTDFTAALTEAERLLSSTEGSTPGRIVFLSDGHAADPAAVRQRLHQRRVQIDVTGIGASPSDVNEDVLRKIASTIDGRTHYQFIADAGTLVAGLTKLAGKSKLAPGDSGV